MPLAPGDDGVGGGGGVYVPVLWSRSLRVFVCGWVVGVCGVVVVRVCL